ncbi:DUF2569 domain-containing protein [Marinobacter hydrocarbonoclasticus]|nr:DUF2569 domain-containing protein [Marinobacter nauticus]
MEATTQQSGAVQEDKGPEGFGGWLILVAIGLIIAPIRLFMELQVYPEIFIDGTYEILSDPSSSVYHPLWGPLIVGEFAFNTLLMLGSLLLIGLFLAKHHWFPRLYILMMAAALIFVPLDLWLTTLVLPDEPVFDPDTTQMVLRLLISSAIWIPYMMRSRRVKNTFVRGKATGGA